MTERSVPPSSGEEVREALAEVLRDQKERAERREQAVPAPKGESPGQVMTAVALLGLTVWVWVFPPSIVRPPPPPPLPARVVEAELRLTVYQAVLAVEAYRERRGMLPRNLAEALGGPEGTEALTYERLDAGRFRVTGIRGEQVVLYETGDPVSALVGNARRMLEAGR